MTNSILMRALEKLTSATGVETRVQPIAEKDHGAVARIAIQFGEESVELDVTVKRHFGNIAASSWLLELAGKTATAPALVTEFIEPDFRRRFREHDLQYVDASGNCFLNKDGLFILIEGKRPDRPTRPKSIRAFKKSGIKLIFLLFSDESAIDKPYRDLSEMAGISRGSVSNVISDLKSLGFVREFEGSRRLTKSDDLTTKWIDGFASNLRTGIRRGLYRRIGTDDELYEWKSWKLNRRDSAWGGEGAADLLTDNLKPELLTLYTNLTNQQLAEAYRLVPGERGRVEVLDMFWDPQATRAESPNVVIPVVPTLLTYADLLLSGKPRGLEVARQLRDRL